MFHGKVGWFWALPSSVCCLTETHLLWGRVEVKNSGHDKQGTPGATSDMQPPPSPTLRLTEGRPPCQSTEAWYYAHKFLLFALYLMPTRVVVTFYLLWLWFLNEKRQLLKDKDKSLFARLHDWVNACSKSTAERSSETGTHRIRSSLCMHSVFARWPQSDTRIRLTVSPRPLFYRGGDGGNSYWECGEAFEATFCSTFRSVGGALFEWNYTFTWELKSTRNNRLQRFTPTVV